MGCVQVSGMIYNYGILFKLATHFFEPVKSIPLKKLMYKLMISLRT